MDELTQKVLDYKKTGEGLEPLTARIRVMVYFFPKKCGGWTWEDSSDFFLYFQDRIPKLLQKFEFMGKNFSSYLAACIRYQMICYQRKCLQARQNEECLCRDQEEAAEEATFHYTPKAAAVGRESPRWEVQENSPMGDLQLDRNRRKILLLCLKSSYYLDAAAIETLNDQMGMPCGSLHSLIQELREDLERSCPKLERLRHRGMKLFLLLNFYQRRQSEELDPEKKPKWTRLCSHYTLQLHRNRQALKSIKIEPRHEAIARVLDLPKGTVDSALHSVKKRLSDLLKTS